MHSLSCYLLSSFFLLYHGLSLDKIIEQDLPLFNYKAHLLEDEYDVYADGAVIYNVNQFPSWIVDSSDNETAAKMMGDEENRESRFDFSESMRKEPESLFETKRGIGIGSSLQDLVLAYSGTECLIIKSDGIRDNLPTDRLIKPWYHKKIGDIYTLRFTSCYIRGEYWDRKKTALSTHFWSLYDYDTYPWFKGDKKVYSISFKMENDIVMNIIVQEWQ